MDFNPRLERWWVAGEDTYRQEIFRFYFANQQVMKIEIPRKGHGIIEKIDMLPFADIEHTAIA